MARPSIPIRQPSRINKKAVVRNNSRPSNRHAPQIRSAGSARCVQRFDDSLLQFTLLIAIRCVLHRWENQEIRCQKLFLKIRRPHYQSISLVKMNFSHSNPRSSKVFGKKCRSVAELGSCEKSISRPPHCLTSQPMQPC